MPPCISANVLRQHKGDRLGQEGKALSLYQGEHTFLLGNKLYPSMLTWNDFLKSLLTE